MKSIFGLFLCLIFSQFIFGQSNSALSNCGAVKFKCTTISSDFYSPISQDVFIFIDEKEFSEKNLRILFEKLSKQYSKPLNLTIRVTTNQAEIIPPPDNGRRTSRGIAVSEQPDPADKYNYYQAIYYRRSRTNLAEYFKYYPVLKTANFVTVVLKRKTK